MILAKNLSILSLNRKKHQ